MNNKLDSDHTSADFKGLWSGTFCGNENKCLRLTVTENNRALLIIDNSKKEYKQEGILNINYDPDNNVITLCINDLSFTAMAIDDKGFMLDVPNEGTFNVNKIN